MPYSGELKICQAGLIGVGVGTAVPFSMSSTAGGGSVAVAVGVGCGVSTAGSAADWQLAKKSDRTRKVSVGRKRFKGLKID